MALFTFNLQWQCWRVNTDRPWPVRWEKQNKSKTNKQTKSVPSSVRDLHQRNKAKSNRAGHQKFSSGLQVHACAHRPIDTGANALSFVDTDFIAYQFFSHSINQACYVLSAFFDIQNGVSCHDLTFRDCLRLSPKSPSLLQTLLMGSIFSPKTYKSRKTSS